MRHSALGSSAAAACGTPDKSDATPNASAASAATPLLSVAGRLQFEQFRIAPPLLQQFGVSAHRLHRPVHEHDDAIGHADARKAVRYQHHRLALAQIPEALEHLELRAGVERRSGL